MAETVEAGPVAGADAAAADRIADGERASQTTSTAQAVPAAATEPAEDAPAGTADDADDAAQAEDADQDGADQDAPQGEDLLVREGDVAGDYLERLLDVLDYDGDIDLDVEAGRAVVSIDGGADLKKLVGQNGSVLEALQELTRLAVQQQTGARSRLMLDVAQWRVGRRRELAETGRSAAEKALATGNPVKLAPMTPFERKIVHDAVAGVNGVHSESEGEEPRRRVVVFRST